MTTETPRQLPDAEMWPIERVKPYPKNAKKHEKAQIEALKASIRRFGWTTAVVVDRNGVLIAGHGRRLAALELGLAEIKVICLKELTPEEADALRLADNRVVSTSYDMELLQEALRDLSGSFDLTELGYSSKELDFLTTDLAAVDDSVFVTDIGAAVDEQKRQDDITVAAIETSQVLVSEGLGFKRVTPAQVRRMKAWIAQIEHETGKTGVEALMSFFDVLGVP